MLQSKTVTTFDTFKPVYFLVKLFGLIPFSVDYSEHNVKVKLLDVVNLMLMLIGWCSILIFRFAKGISVQNKSSSFARTGGSLGTYCGYILLIGSVMSNFINRHKFMKILCNLKAFDLRVSS